MEILPVHSQCLYHRFRIDFPYPFLKGAHAVVSGAGSKSFILHGRVYFFSFRIYFGSLHRLGFRPPPAMLSKKGRKTKKGTVLWFQVLFLASLLPYIILLALCIHSYFAGVNTGWWVSNMEYRWAAVRYTSFWHLLIQTGIQVLPICMIIQIAYIMHRVQNKR